MDPIYIALIVVGAVALLAILLMLLYLFMTGSRREQKGIERFVHAKYAHRGLHGDGRAENSLSAFAAAKAAGFGIELDIRLSSDGEIVVFHDTTLERMCAMPGRAEDYTAQELKNMKLAGTEDGIPTLREVLSLIDGAVPLLIEMKGDADAKGIAEKLLEQIRDYRGDFWVESFNPVSLRVIRRARPDIYIGILALQYTKEERFRGSLLYRMLENLCFNFLMRPDFISYEKHGYAKAVVRRLRRRLGTPLVAWTICSETEEAEALGRGFDTVIFENYVPEK